MVMKIIISLLVTLYTFTDGCDCDKKKNNDHNPSRTIEVETEKRFIDSEDIKTTEPLENFNDYEETTKMIHLNETHFELNEEEFKTNATEEEDSEACVNYKNGFAFDMDKMADVWQTAYYRMAETLMCFKIHIKKITIEERIYYRQKYGDFNRTIDWEYCFMEIKSSDKAYSSERKHFLQGNKIDQGVLDNVVIFEEDVGGNIKLTLNDESADQWLVIKNLLLMRDCDNGDVVVFSRVPHQPRLDDILEALRAFGEESLNGTIACTDAERNGRSIRHVLRVLNKFD